MKSTASTLIVVVSLAVGIAVGVGVARTIDSARSTRELIPPPGIVDLQETFASVSEHVKPAVVHITTKYETFSKQFRSVQQNYGSQENTGIGSGVIVNAREGYILTNNHVIQDAREIFVMLLDGKVYRAGVVGTDSVTDLAVVKLASPPPGLVEAVFGDSDRVRVGDFAIAVGSPFGLHHTVTSGIISAKGRRAKLDRVQDFIQTDAQISPGNSGGPLVNLYGHIIGINTAMVVGPDKDQDTRANGIGLAIPSNTARWVYERIIQEGRVRRGYLGVRVGAINDGTAAHFGYQSLGQLVKELGLDDLQGCVVMDVLRDSPALAAGLVVGDVITKFNDRQIKDDSDLILKMSMTAPGAQVTLTVIRAGKSERKIVVQVAETPGARVIQRPR